MAEYDGQGNLIAQYIYAGNKAVARIDAKGKMFFFRRDRLGSVRLITDEAGIAVQASEYFAFGEDLKTTGSLADYTLSFTGQEKDQNLGLFYFSARHYHPGLGRFLQPDPIVPDLEDSQSWNRYSYVRNNPVNRSDPDGHADRDERKKYAIDHFNWKPELKRAAQDFGQTANLKFFFEAKVKILDKGPNTGGSIGVKKAYNFKADSVETKKTLSFKAGNIGSTATFGHDGFEKATLDLSAPFVPVNAKLGTDGSVTLGAEGKLANGSFAFDGEGNIASSLAMGPKFEAWKGGPEVTARAGAQVTANTGPIDRFLNLVDQALQKTVMQLYQEVYFQRP